LLVAVQLLFLKSELVVALTAQEGIDARPWPTTVALKVAIAATIEKRILKLEGVRKEVE